MKTFCREAELDDEHRALGLLRVDCERRERREADLCLAGVLREPLQRGTAARDPLQSAARRRKGHRACDEESTHVMKRVLM